MSNRQELQRRIRAYRAALLRGNERQVVRAWEQLEAAREAARSEQETARVVSNSHLGAAR